MARNTGNESRHQKHAWVDARLFSEALRLPRSRSCSIPRPRHCFLYNGYRSTPSLLPSRTSANKDRVVESGFII